jgi:hypothetical protein
MDWTAISSASDLVAAIAVVVSLLYVAIQLRQNTKAIEASSRQGLLDGDLGLISEYMSHAVDPHLIGDDVKLSPEDERRFFWLVVKALRIREFAWHQYNSGILDESTWQSYMAPVGGIFSTKRARAVLDIYTGSAEFMQVIRSHLAVEKAPPPEAA